MALDDSLAQDESQLLAWDEEDRALYEIREGPGKDIRVTANQG
jgi:hypothetical protein